LRVERGTALLQTLQALGEIDDAFIAALESEQAATLPVQDRESL
jgi:antitoxin VapB